MAATTAATSSTSTSICLHNRITNISFFDHSAISIAITLTKTKPKLLLLRTQIFPIALVSLFSQSHLCRASAAFEDAHDSQIKEEEEEEEEVQEAAAEGNRLYVGNLPYAMTSSQLADIFGEAGRVDAVEIVYDRVTDRSRGFAFVRMASVEEAKQAIRMFDGSQVGGRSVKVNFPEVPRGAEKEVMGPKIRSSYRGFIDSSHKIYAGNLSWSLTSQDLRDAFTDQPGLLSAKVIYDRDTGKSKGFGFVSFSTPEEAQSALDAMNGVEVEGRPLRLNMAAERASASLPLQRRETDFDGSAVESSISVF